MAAVKLSTQSPTARKPPLASTHTSAPTWPRRKHPQTCEGPMPDISVNFCGVRSPNPFWLGSGPPANTAYQVMRAFDAGWGGAVWKTIGEPIMNVSSRYGSIDYKNERMIGLNNIELISDRPIETNFTEITQVKKKYPKH